MGTPRLGLRRSILLLGALSWIALPVSLYAGPGGSGGGHGGGGGSHGGGGGSHGGVSHGGGSHVGSSGGGAHFGGAVHPGASGQASPAGRASASSGAAYAHSASIGLASRPAGSGANALSSFAAVEDVNHGRGSAAADPNLRSMAGHGWSFLPSSGITRTAPAPRVPARPVTPGRSPAASIPAILPVGPHHHPHHPHHPIVIYPGGGGCFFNGFTNVCGGGGFFYGGVGANYCFTGYGFWNCGYGGYGLGYANGYGYGPGPGYGLDVNAYSENEGYDSPNNSGRMDIYGGYTGDAPENSDQNTSAAPQAPRAQIILKNGSAYEVTAYWLSNGELYYRPVTGGLSHVPVDQLDLTATVEANSRNGVTFQLTDHPAEP